MATGDARTITAANFIIEVQFDLRDKLTASKFVANELFTYLNRCYEMIYMILVDMNSELVATRSGTITLADGTETYALTSNSMSDFWKPFKLNRQNGKGEDLYAIYLTDSSSGVFLPLPMLTYDERFDYLVSGTAGEAQPQGFYIFGNNMGFLPVPDTAYTCTIPAYFPNFVPLSATSENMPLKNLFNQDIAHGMMMWAKMRNDYPVVSIETQLMDYFRERAMKIVEGREKKESKFSPIWRSRRRR